ncbi:GGDEF domain-containing protein [Thiosulfativibrio zosterae]|uniref:diguanylate cyclase n=1 Tax=Thiosulfativibrio zosterae TaxID=2675053 RepID=A0A6F8PQT0_9GAMM|nr:GGDEF domain-containing protein [Thiosulfativibrio zosterae]BBP44387.1 hypothetical protein THMIRHAT_21330 [Thiosulfativibrio zosterae]
MKPPNPECFNRFPTLLIISDRETRKIEYCNDFSAAVLLYSKTDLEHKIFEDVLSSGSIIFFESYIEPLLKEYGECHEVQITLLTKEHLRIPAVANISAIDNKLYWSIHTAVKRDKLYQELIETRDSLEEKTDKLRSLARTDPLTQLLNRRAALYDLNKIMEQNKRRYVPLAFLLIDIDYFKKVNDEHGHDKGDEILQKLAKTLLKSIRSADIVARWGGEEFLIVLYNSEPTETCQFTERLHEQVNKILINGKPITISIGISQTNTESQHIESIVKQADIALYQAKNNGRNRTEFFKEYDPILN